MQIYRKACQWKVDNLLSDGTERGASAVEKALAAPAAPAVAVSLSAASSSVAVSGGGASTGARHVSDSEIRQRIWEEHALRIRHQAYCQFDFEKNMRIPALEIMSYSLQETASRHVMVFTKANAALFLLFSMKMVRKEQCTVIFNCMQRKDQAMSTSELVQQMMRIKG